MKKSAVIFTLVLPMSVYAQNPGKANQEQMMQQMQACMQNIDQAALQSFSERAEQMGKEIQALCAAGKRDEAMEKAVVFAKFAADNKSMQEMRKCGEGMQGMMPKMPMAEQNDDDDDDISSHHVCDQYESSPAP